MNSPPPPVPARPVAEKRYAIFRRRMYATMAYTTFRPDTPSQNPLPIQEMST